MTEAKPPFKIIITEDEVAVTISAPLTLVQASQLGTDLIEQVAAAALEDFQSSPQVPLEKTKYAALITGCPWCNAGGLGGAPSIPPPEAVHVPSMAYLGLADAKIVYAGSAEYSSFADDSGGGSNCPRCAGSGLIPIKVVVAEKGSK